MMLRRHSMTVACTALMAALGPKVALAADGPGIPSLTYQTAELGREISLFGPANFGGGPAGSNIAIMLHGYLVTLATNDSGVGPGVFHTFNVGNPRQPVPVASFNGAGTNIMREQHMMPLAMVGGRELLAAPTTQGIQIWDVTDPAAIRLVSTLALAGTQGGDYDNAVWMLSWQWPYLFAGGTQNGVFIIDTHNPAQPTLLNRIPIQSMGNFRVGALFAMGNHLVAMTHEAECAQTALNCPNPATINQISVLDVGDPTRPMLLTTSKVPFAFYSGLALGDRLYLGGDFGQVGIMSWSPTGITMISQKFFATCPNAGGPCAAKGGYCSYQDGFIFCGQSEMGFIKLDVHDAASEANPTQVLHGDLTDPAADTDFSTVFGNLLYLGNDHGSGSGFVPHDTRPDTFPPKLVRTFPANGATMQPLGTRVTIHLSDVIDNRSVTAASFMVRPLGGTPLAGNYSMTSTNAISFGANDPLLPNTTYEITLLQGGLRDVMQNALATTISARFSTGATVDTTPSAPLDAGVTEPTDATRAADARPMSTDASGDNVSDESGTSSAGASGAAGAGGSPGAVAPESGTSSGGQTGEAGTGGSTSGTGGAPGGSGTSGSLGMAGQGQPPPAAGGSSSSGGCGCEVGRHARRGWAALAFAPLALMGARRLRRGKRRTPSARA